MAAVQLLPSVRIIPAEAVSSPPIRHASRSSECSLNNIAMLSPPLSGRPDLKTLLVRPRWSPSVGSDGWCVRAMAAQASTLTGAEFTSPKAGTVGEDRFRESAVPGTYWSTDKSHFGDKIAVAFTSGGEKVVTSARVGENLLQVAASCGVLVPNQDFCFEGTCCHCEVDVKGGATEVGYRADTSGGNIVRSCICPVPSHSSTVEVTILSEDDAWGEGVL